jgi:hypothetical protein
MKRRYAALILGLAGLLVCQTTRNQQAHSASGSASATTRASAAPDPLKDPAYQRRFEAMFGPEALKVDLSTSKLDDAIFAEKLAAAAAKAEGDTGFQVYLYDKVCIFALRLPRTLTLVRGALAKLDSLAPGQRHCWEDYRLEFRRQSYRQAKPAERTAFGEDLISQLIVVGDLRGEAGKWDEAAELYQQAYQTASSHKSRQKDVAAEKLNLATRAKEVVALRRQLDQNPGNTVLRMSLIDSYLGVLDDPAGAAGLLNADVNEAYRTYVPLAARLPSSLASGPLMELGDWYKSLARPATSASRATLAKRAKSYYLAHIQAIRQEGVTVSGVQEAVKKINAGLKEIGSDKIDRLFFRDPAIEESFDKALQWLWTAQRPDGAWLVNWSGNEAAGGSGSGSGSGYVGGYDSSYGSHYYGDYNTFSTAAALAALLAGGASVDDARIAKALRWLELTATTQTNGMAFRCLAWTEVQKQKPGRAGQMLVNDTATLIRATRTGGYGSTVTSWDYPSFGRSWQAPVGVDAADQSGLKGHGAYWQQIVSYWTGMQGTDGSISPDDKNDTKKVGAMPTIIGAGSLAIAMTRLYGPEAVKKSDAKSEPLARAMAWLDENLKTQADLFRGSMGGSSGSQNAYYDGGSSVYATRADVAYMLSRLGLATGRDKFGKVNWWNDTSKHVMGWQKSNGSWGDTAETTMVILFLINGYKFEQTYQGELPSLLTRPAPTPETTEPPDQKKAPAKKRMPKPM